MKYLLDIPKVRVIFLSLSDDNVFVIFTFNRSPPDKPIFKFRKCSIWSLQQPRPQTYLIRPVEECQYKIKLWIVVNDYIQIHLRLSLRTLPGPLHSTDRSSSPLAEGNHFISHFDKTVAWTNPIPTSHIQVETRARKLKKILQYVVLSSRFE